MKRDPKASLVRRFVSAWEPRGNPESEFPNESRQVSQHGTNCPLVETFLRGDDKIRTGVGFRRSNKTYKEERILQRDCQSLLGGCFSLAEVPMPDPARPHIGKQVIDAISQSQLVVIVGEKGLGQKSTIDVALETLTDWDPLAVNGDWLTKGYLAGFQDLVDLAFRWCDRNRPEIISRHEQSIKRMFPLYESRHFQVPKDLTNTSSKDERTRFYHHEYQNKLLVGLFEFMLEYLGATANPRLLIIDNAAAMSPTALSLLHIFLRNPASSALIKFVLIDYNRQLFIPEAVTVEFPKYTFEEMDQFLNLKACYPTEKAHQIYLSSCGNAMMARAIVVCEQGGVPVVGYVDSKNIVDLYLATLDHAQRQILWSRFVAQDCESEDYIEIRNYQTFDSEFADKEHQERHRQCMADYEAGLSPLITLHARAIRDKYKRLEALAEPSEILKNIGLYDTWFSYFGEIFADSQLRHHGSGDEPSNAAFINAAFVLYSLGCAKVSVPYLDEFYESFPQSKFIPTVLYAQSMTYGRYQQPVNLPLAEQFALLNLETIEKSFKNYEKYHYIKVFAENAYAYIKARQGKYDEALALCTSGNEEMLDIYGDRKFRLHQSILIYNTSQVYEILKDYDRAEAQLRLAISYDPYYGEYHNDLGNLLSNIPSRIDEALASYQRAIDLCPPYYEAHLNRGVLLASLGNDDAAVRDFERALEIKPNEWRAFLERGNLSLTQGRYEEARLFFSEALAIEPRSVDLHCNMGLACSECGDIESSVAHYRAAIALDPRHGAAHNNLAVELFKTAREEEALRHAAIAVEIGGDPDYERNLRYIEENIDTALVS